MKSFIKYSFIFISVCYLASCEPCEDCGPQNAYPYITLQVFNKTSIDTLKQYRARLNQEITAIENALENPDNAPFADSLNTQNTIKTDSLALINSLISTINDYLISIESINGRRNLYENNNGGDSLSQFRLPLNTLDTIADYNIKFEFADSIRNLQLSYQLKDTTLNDKITRVAKELRVITHQFDSLRGPYGCSPVINCSSNELNLYVEI